ncbi:MAG: regulatory iron-sulfur-containing complex subunit RicT [Candidatus Auribacterota bacterium]|jgi:cell fate regulator YaaT (PSP1 superfamily)|nr:regulatory iron-sulfur-containing complex subunit RicT [Candidatus Auribacterota bacterium]
MNDQMNQNKQVADNGEKWFYLHMRRAGRNYVCKPPADIEISQGDHCVVELERAEDYAKILCCRVPTDEEKKNTIVKRIKRKMTDKDWERVEDNKKKAEYAYLKCQRRIADHKLDMKLVDVEYSLDCSRIIFYFTADGRVDFRELVKSLASEFRARIELRQIGVRDESGILGGIGCCGRELCCSKFLYEFDPINIKMAKVQRLPLNPTKISGLCGRLHCCLRYEYKYYKKASKMFPKEGSLVSTKSGQGRVIDLNIVKESLLVQFESGTITEVALKDVKVIKEERKPSDASMAKKLADDIDERELKQLEDIPGGDLDDDDDE